MFDNDFEIFGDAAEFPIVATTYRLTEHFHYWTKNVHIDAVLQPEAFIELSEQLAQEKGISQGPAGPDLVAPRRGQGEGDGDEAASSRFRIDGKTIHTVGLPLHFGFIGLTKKASPINSLTPPVADANALTPEFKAFLVDIAPIAEPVA